MFPFYYFLPKGSIEEKYDNRYCLLPANVPLKGIHFDVLNKDQWLMPPYKEYFSKLLTIVFEAWYSEFSGAIVKSTSSYKELINLVNKYFM